jgi:thiamine kinase-like enzyme
MLPHELERVAARCVPGKGKPDVHRLSNGLVNETYRVERDGTFYAMRVAALNPYGLGLDRAWEASVLAGAVAAELAPVPEYCDWQRGILITRWVHGRLWNPADVRRRSNISRIAELARRIHALPMPVPARVMSPMKWIEHYSAAARQGTLRDSNAAPGAAALRTAATQRLTALAALPGVDPVVCHSDMHALNLIDRGDSLVLLDWEYAHASDPLWDLAGWKANNDLEEQHAQDLLADYAGRPPTRDEFLRLQLLSWLYDYVCLVWSEIYVNLQRDDRPGPAPGDTPKRDARIEGVAARALELEARLHTKRW